MATVRTAIRRGGPRRAPHGFTIDGNLGFPPTLYFFNGLLRAKHRQERRTRKATLEWVTVGVLTKVILNGVKDPCSL